MFDTLKRSRVKKTIRIDGAEPYHLLGVDLGERNDYTAIAYIEAVPVLRRIQEESGRKYTEATLLYRCLRLERPELGTKFPTVVDRIANMCVTLGQNKHGVELVVDVVGPGAGVRDFIVPAYTDLARGTDASMRPGWIWTTSGGSVNFDGEKLNVPRKNLINAGIVAIEDDRYQVAKMPLRETLQNEMRTFAIKKTQAGNERFEHYREDDKDDLVTAGILLPVWLGEHFIKPAVAEKYTPARHNAYDPLEDIPAPGGRTPILGTPLPPLP
jgi:hypothetical protein